MARRVDPTGRAAAAEGGRTALAPSLRSGDRANPPPEPQRIRGLDGHPLGEGEHRQVAVVRDGQRLVGAEERADQEKLKSERDQIDMYRMAISGKLLDMLDEPEPEAA